MLPTLTVPIPYLSTTRPHHVPITTSSSVKCSSCGSDYTNYCDYTDSSSISKLRTATVKHYSDMAFLESCGNLCKIHVATGKALFPLTSRLVCRCGVTTALVNGLGSFNHDDCTVSQTKELEEQWRAEEDQIQKDQLFVKLNEAFENEIKCTEEMTKELADYTKQEVAKHRPKKVTVPKRYFYWNR